MPKELRNIHITLTKQTFLATEYFYQVHVLNYVLTVYGGQPRFDAW
jgi:hypothetical protein